MDMTYKILWGEGEMEKLLQIALLDTDHYPIVLTLLSFHDHFRNPNTTQNNKIHANPIPTCNGKKDFQLDPT